MSDIPTMAWKGIDGDNGIWYTTGTQIADGTINWASQNPVSDVGTSVGPALAAYIGLLTMAWKGVDGDDGIWYTSGNQIADGTINWVSQNPVPGVGTSVGPALAVYNNNFILAWKGVDGDNGIWYTTGPRNADGTVNWASQKSIPGVATSVRPSLAVCNGILTMAWKGVDSDNGIYHTTGIPTAEGISWLVGGQMVPGVGTSVGPALAACNGILTMAWKGIDGDNGIWYTTFTQNAGWKPQNPVPGVGTSVGPALAALPT